MKEDNDSLNTSESALLAVLQESMNQSSLEERIKNLTAKTIEDSAEEYHVMSNKTDLVFIFDKSGSCAGTEQAMKQGFADIINRELEDYYNDLVTTVLFNDVRDLVDDRVPVDDVTMLNYEAYGRTAFYDAVCNTILNLDKAHKDSGEYNETFVAIMTDGYDNASRKYGLYDLRTLIEEKRREGWHFVFLGKMIDAKDFAAAIGIDRSMAEVYDSFKLEAGFDSFYKAIEDVHENGKVSKDWSNPIKDSRRQLTDGSDHVKKLGRRKKHGK